MINNHYENKLLNSRKQYRLFKKSEYLYLNDNEQLYNERYKLEWRVERILSRTSRKRQDELFAEFE